MAEESTKTQITQDVGGDTSRPQDAPRQDTERPNEPAIPKSRFDEINRRMKEAEKKASELETAQTQRDDQQAKAQGEYQDLAEKRQKRVDALQNEVTELKGQIVRDSRYRSFVGASGGTILPEALDDAFGMVSEDEWATVNEEDENGVRMLAQNLAERKPYLAASPRGAGSGGSGRPVFGLAANGAKAGTSATGRKPIFSKPKKHWG